MIRMHSTRLSGKRQTKRRRGAAIVEVAVCFPVFMLILLGVIEFGRALMVSQLLTNAAREACRDAIIDGSTNDSVTAACREIVTNTVGCQNNDVTVDIEVTDVDDGSVLNDVSDAERRDLIKIDVTVPHDVISFAVGRYLTGKTLRGQCAMRKE